MIRNMRELVIDGRSINDNEPCYVVAEIGNNHMGKIDIAKKMIAKAKNCGADAVKFQKRNNKALMTAELYNKDYDNRNSFGPTYGAHREALEFGWDDYVELVRYSKEIGITFFATPFDAPSVDFLMELDVPAFKIASADLTNLPMLEKVARLGLPTIISTGGATMDEVRAAYAVSGRYNPGNVAMLQCTAGYPTKHKELDLRVITTYRQEFPQAVIGLSSHDIGYAASVAALTLGARIVEKHFTLNRAWRGTDHSFSLEPADLRDLVKALKSAQSALGSPTKRCYDSEAGPMKKMRKKIVAARDMPEGHVLGAEDLDFKCPGNGISPDMAPTFVGKKLTRFVEEEMDITPDCVEGASECCEAS